MLGVEGREIRDRACGNRRRRRSPITGRDASERARTFHSSLCSRHRLAANSGNHDEALKVFERVTKATPDAAQTAYRLLLTTDDGIQPNGKIDIAGTATVLKLRSEYGQPRRTLADPAKYVDERYYRATIAR